MYNNAIYTKELNDLLMFIMIKVIKSLTCANNTMSAL